MTTKTMFKLLLIIAVAGVLLACLTACQSHAVPQPSSCDSPASHAAQGGTTGIPACRLYV